MQLHCKEKPVLRSWCFGIRKAVPIAALSLGTIFAVSPVNAQTLPGVYTNSWIGNTYGTPADHIAHTIDTIYVTPSGKVATITGWDEGGANAALYSSTGAKIGIPVESGTGSWGRNSGSAVFANDTYLYQSMSQSGGSATDSKGIKYPSRSTTIWSCIRRFNQDGSSAPFTGGKGYDGTMLVVSSGTIDKTPTGVVVLNNELYVSDPIAGRVKVYNASTMSATPVRTLTIANVGLLDYDRLGFIWMLDTVQKKLIRFSSTGAIQSQSITFPSGVVPTGFCVDRVNDRILVTNNGNDQNVLIYTNIFSAPAQTATFGNTGGINSGTAGVVAPLKFSEPKGVGVDSSGNIFVGNNAVNGGGGRLEKYNSGGTLQWALKGIIFTANGDLNPADETEFYTHEFKFKLNLGNTTPGSEWSYAAQTLNKVKYPGDLRIPIAGSANNTFWTTAYTRNVSGKKLLFTSDMYSGELGIYRFNAATDGETAIPSGLLLANAPDEIWRDSNGNGIKESSETETRAEENPGGSHFFPDANGGIWKSNGENATAKIRYFPMQGFDGNGNPQYTYASSRAFVPSEFYAVRRMEYDAASDVLYAAGENTSGSIGSDWGTAGDKLVRYNNFLGTRTTAWSIALPISSTSPASNLNVKAFCEAGEYLFLIANRDGRIYVHKKTDGSKVGEIMPTSATGSKSGWADINGAIRATKRSNGEYLIFAEENGYGKVMMYRWNPTPAPTPTPTSGGSISVASASTSTAIDLTSSGTSDWVKWGTSDATSADRKATGGTQISNYAKIGTGTIARYTDSGIGYSWTGGTPTASATNNITGIYSLSIGTGFSFTVPADTTTRTVKVYVGGWNSTGQLTATLSDGSAAAYTATPVHSSAGDVNTVYTITYNAASASKLLTVNWTMTAGAGEVTLQAAVLQ